MIHKWEIKTSGDADNKKFTLLIDGNSNDVGMLLESLPNKCLPPEAAKPPYRYQFTLNAEQNELDSIRDKVREIIKKSKNLDEFLSEEEKQKYEDLVKDTELLPSDDVSETASHIGAKDTDNELKELRELRKKTQEKENKDKTSTDKNSLMDLQKGMSEEEPLKVKDTTKSAHSEEPEEEMPTKEQQEEEEALLKTDMQIPYLDISDDEEPEQEDQESSEQDTEEPAKDMAEITERIKSKAFEKLKQESKNPHLEDDFDLSVKDDENKDEEQKDDKTSGDIVDEILQDNAPQKSEPKDKSPRIKKKDKSGFNIMEDSMLADELENTALSHKGSKEERAKQETNIKEKMFKEMLDQDDKTATRSELGSLIEDITNTDQPKTDKNKKPPVAPPPPQNIKEEPKEMPKPPSSPKKEEPKKPKEETLKEKTEPIVPPTKKPPIKTKADDEESKDDKEVTDILSKDLPPITTQKNIAFKKKPASPTAMKKEYQSIELPEEEDKAEEHNWSLEMPLVPTQTFANMIIGSNRFAHATTMTVVGSLGKMYNPLFLHGSNGTGKTHFINAIAYEISKNIGLDKIFITNGVRFSRGIQRFVTENRVPELEKFLNDMQVLLIDDVHLMAVNKHNKELISKILNDFAKNNKQIVLTSKYPPTSLVKLEELIKFNFNNGWTAQLKYPTEANFLKIIAKQLESAKISLEGDDQIKEYFDAYLSKAARIINRVKVLHNLVDKKDEAIDAKKLLELILAKKGEDEESIVVKEAITNAKTITKTGNGEWGKIGFFYPYGHSEQMKWVIYALSKRAEELKIPGGFEVGLKSAYKTDNFISSAFKIANICDNKKLKGAVILGPPKDICKGAVKGNFYDILTHMLEVMLIRCGIVNYENLKTPSSYTKVLSEILK